MGIGDDAAVLRSTGHKTQLFTTDMMVENVHFTLETCAPEWLAYKLLARNVSDIAAMGGTPTCYVLSLAVPRNLPEDFLPRFYRGLKHAQKRMHAHLVGGDISSSPAAVLFSCIALLGETMAAPLLRAGSKPNDSIWVTGALGRSAVALELLRSGRAAVDTKNKRIAFAAISQAEARGRLKDIMKAHFFPQPRLAMGQWLAKRKIASAVIDLSDGLSTDLHRLCEASGLSAVIYPQHLPIARSVLLHARDPVECALHGGEDYELLFTVPPRMEAKLKRLSAPLPLRRIGKMMAGKKKGVLVEMDGRLQQLEPGGFDHFSNR
jgi:thiamine-monophosphate kinase